MILAIVLIVIPAERDMKTRSQITARVQRGKAVSDLLAEYRREHGFWPANADDFSDGDIEVLPMKYMNLSSESREKLLADLESMPAFLAESFSRLPSSLHAAAGPDGGFSPVEHAWHLADLEEMGFAERIRRLRAEPGPVLPDFAGDVVARERDYKSLSLSEGIAQFRRARERNLSALRSLGHDEWLRGGEQEGVGPVSLCDLPSMMAEHDGGHRQEIEAWLVYMKR